MLKKFEKSSFRRSYSFDHSQQPVANGNSNNNNNNEVSPSKRDVSPPKRKSRASTRGSRSSSLSDGAALASDPPVDLLLMRLNRLEKKVDSVEKDGTGEVKRSIMGELLDDTSALNKMCRSHATEQYLEMAQKMEESLDYLEDAKMEAEELKGQLEEKLEGMKGQEKRLLELLEAAPNMEVFPKTILKLRVGEHVFHTSLSTLCKDSSSMLAAMFSGKFGLVKDDDGFYFIDRDGKLFHHILSFLRSAKIPKDLQAKERDELIEECTFYGLQEFGKMLRKEADAQMIKEEEHSEKSTMSNIQAIATSSFVHSVIATLAEVTHLAFRQMAADAENGNSESVLRFQPGQLYHDFFVAPDGTHKKTIFIFLELLRQEGANCTLESSGSTTITIRCSLLRSDREICMEVLKNFKKMRGFATK